MRAMRVPYWTTTKRDMARVHVLITFTYKEILVLLLVLVILALVLVMLLLFVLSYHVIVGVGYRGMGGDCDSG